MLVYLHLQSRKNNIFASGTVRVHALVEITKIAYDRLMLFIMPFYAFLANTLTFGSDAIYIYHKVTNV